MKQKKRKLKVLVIDDDPASVEILKFKIEETSFQSEMIVRETAEEALTYLHSLEGLPDLIFLDIYLPGEDGLTFLGELKKHPKFHSIPVIVHSVSNENIDIIESYKRGGALFLSKIGDSKILEETLHQLITFGMLKKNEDQ